MQIADKSENSQPLQNLQGQNQILLQVQEEPWNGRQVSRWTPTQKLFIGAGVIMAAIMSINAWINQQTYQQNKLINEINCHIGESIDGVIHDFNYFNNAKNASDQYCLAEIFRTGNGTQQSLAEARNWYKKAAEQGLDLAKKALCQPSMFEHKFKLGDLYSEFRSLCCKETSSFHENTSCPWYDHYKTPTTG